MEEHTETEGEKYSQIERDRAVAIVVGMSNDFPKVPERERCPRDRAVAMVGGMSDDFPNSPG